MRGVVSKLFVDSVVFEGVEDEQPDGFLEGLFVIFADFSEFANTEFIKKQTLYNFYVYNLPSYRYGMFGV